jgi:hypothetical protein
LRPGGARGEQDQHLIRLKRSARRCSIRHRSSAVERLLTLSAVDLPRRTRQRLICLLLGILLSGTLVLRRIATTHAT